MGEKKTIEKQNDMILKVEKTADAQKRKSSEKCNIERIRVCVTERRSERAERRKGLL